MSSPEVDQLSFLSRAFGAALNRYPCGAVALLGCATGNGLEHVDPLQTKTLTAVDINPDYLEITNGRFGGALPCLETIAGDLATCSLPDDTYDQVFAGLLFEYVRPETLLPRISRWLKSDGVLVTILQLPVTSSGMVSHTRFKSLDRLNSVMALVVPADFERKAAGADLRKLEDTVQTLKSGKSFQVCTFQKIGRTSVSRR